MTYSIHIEYDDGALGSGLGDMHSSKVSAIKVARSLAKTAGGGAQAVVVMDNEKQTVAEFKVKGA